jgi:Alginate export
MQNFNINRLLGVGLFLCTFLTQASAQLTMSAQIRPRAESRSGLGTLKLKDAPSAGFISQRSRLGFNYKMDKVTFGMSIQDIRVWGQDAGTISNADGTKLGVHEAWAEVNLLDTIGLTLKMGRQELLYDDSRLLGNLDWLQQGRRHDAAVLKVNKNGWQVDFGLAFNQNTDAFGATGTFYTPGNTPQYLANSKGVLTTIPAGFVPVNARGVPVLAGGNPSTNGGTQMYKTMQYLYAAKKFKAVKASFLLFKDDFAKYRLDTLKAADGGTLAGRRYDVTGKNSRITAGLLLNGTTKGGFTYTLGGYLQSGKNRDGAELSAYTATAYLGYTKAKFTIGVGYDVLSGNDLTNTTSTKDTKFDPLYGTPHKFWGLMDYFYVGTGGVAAGLSDPYLRLKYAASPKFTMGVDVHNFSLVNNMPDKSSDATGKTLLSKQLGNELDFIVNYTLNKATGIELGYCVMAATNSLEYVKLTTKDKAEHTATWAYLMISIKPEIFSTVVKK